MADTSTVSGTTTTESVATGTTATADVKFVTPEDFDGFKQFSNRESVARRKEVESLASQFKEFREVIESRLPVPAATGEGKGGKDLPTAEIERKVKALQDQLEKSEREKSDALISSAINEAVAPATPEAKKVLAKALRADVRIENVDGQNVVVVNGEDGPQRLTAELVRKTFGDTWYPATGKPGSGLTGGGTAGNPGVDVARAMADQKYFDDNRAAVLAEIARTKSIGG